MQQQNIKLALSIVLLLISMLILSFPSVHIYSLFCKATGFGGTVTRQESFLKPQKGTRKIIVELGPSLEICSQTSTGRSNYGRNRFDFL